MQKNNSLVKAINKNVRTSARKLALVCNFIKGKKADVALRDLEFSRKRIAKDVSKTVKSAISNAENNYQYDIDNLFVKEAYVGKSLVMKRFRPRAKGRASPIKKPFSRITIVLEEKIEKKSKGEEELDEGTLNESGGPEESPSDEAIHLLARGIEMGDKKMLDQAKSVKGVSAEVKKSLNVIVKCVKEAMSKDS